MRVEMDEVLGMADEIVEAIVEAGAVQAAAILMAHGVDSPAARAVRLVEEVRLDQSRLNAEHRAAQQRLADEARARREVMLAHVQEIEERLARPEGLDESMGDGGPTLRELLTEERDALQAELYG